MEKFPGFGSRTRGQTDEENRNRLYDALLFLFDGGVDRKRKSQTGNRGRGGPASSFPLNPLSIDSPGGNLFTVSAALMSRKYPKHQRDGGGGWENYDGEDEDGGG